MLRLDQALLALKAGQVVAAVTESSFGLLADIHSDAALNNLLALKPRGADKGQPVIVPDEACWSGLVTRVPPQAAALARRFWPGRLSIVLEATRNVDPRVALGSTLAVRVPGPSPALDLVRAFGGPLTATSANLPGQAPALDADELQQSFRQAIQGGRLAVLSGRAPGGAPSTLVRIGPDGFEVLREGAIPTLAISETLGLTGSGAMPH